ncbi:exported hypothetical protein [Candidatus Microthrix parvicella RN1]|uniref:Uncharacterized protein n=1 Tax=Candidatus Neomicrothrix parvicella RN1 TaxID=1229780 RepID=R4Z155_9ACTN|nr:exported hypothetical protein [Candidatus Microthrix parvicella RN1]
MVTRAVSRSIRGLGSTTARATWATTTKASPQTRSTMLTLARRTDSAHVPTISTATAIAQLNTTEPMRFRPFGSIDLLSLAAARRYHL